jgi:cation transport regulator ChaB
MGQRLYNANDGVTGRDGGPYLDVVEAEEAEKRRAVVEDREPDFDNLPATAGIQLNSAAQMLYTEHINNAPSRQNTAVDDADRRFDALHDDDNTPLRAWTEVPDDSLTNKDVDEVNALTGDDQDTNVEDEGTAPDNTTGTGSDSNADPIFN